MGFFSRLFGKDEAASGSEAVNGVICAPFRGTVIPLEQVPDAVFSQGVLGRGCGIEPAEDTVYAPFDGEVTQVTDTLHAVGLTGIGGVELLIHVGIDTVDMNGDGFACLVKEGQKVKRGTPLLTFSREKIAAAGYPATTVVVVTNTDDFAEVAPAASGEIERGAVLLTVTR